ncbi:unnamed protein product [Heligmosomoides polygyrus]|uniref:DUF1758 domain-containing protein n=1 Tax=Heligmosomoides polygyrus TaxID=6339 RepID=A0A183GFA3_HELPZ|nr:unnamed protein product [Heligmosomoides polygyrus]
MWTETPHLATQLRRRSRSSNSGTVKAIQRHYTLASRINVLQPKENCATYLDSRQTEDGEDIVPAEGSQAIMEINGQSPPRAQLLTVSADVVGPTQSVKAAVLLDTGSELSFIHSSIADQLQLPPTSVALCRKGNPSAYNLRSEVKATKENS